MILNPAERSPPTRRTQPRAYLYLIATVCIPCGDGVAFRADPPLAAIGRGELMPDFEWAHSAIHRKIMTGVTIEYRAVVRQLFSYDTCLMCEDLNFNQLYALSFNQPQSLRNRNGDGSERISTDHYWTSRATRYFLQICTRSRY